jgi:hypothetical protein
MVPLDALAVMAEPLLWAALDAGSLRATRPLPARTLAARDPVAPAEAAARAVRFFALSQIPAIRRLP